MSEAKSGVVRLGEADPHCASLHAGYFSLLLALVVIMNLVQQAAAVGFERPVMDAGRPARIGRRLDALATLAVLVVADDEVAGDQVDLLPMVVHERCGGVGPRLEPQQPRAASHLAGLVEVAGQDLLLDAGRIARRRRPAG